LFSLKDASTVVIKYYFRIDGLEHQENNKETLDTTRI